MLRKHLVRTGRFIKFLDFISAGLAWSIALFGTWLGGSLVDHWVLALPRPLRWLIWLSFVGSFVYWFARHAIPLAVRRINPEYVAKRIEQAEPDLRNGLISWLQLESIPENGVPRGIMAGLVRHAARFVEPQDPASSIDTRAMIRLAGVALLAVVALSLYGMVSPKSPIISGMRMLMPWSDISAPTRVRIISLSPGDVELIQGRPLQVDVELRGLRTGEPVHVRITTDDGQIRDRRTALAALTEGYRYAGNITTESNQTVGASSSAGGIQNELSYWIEAGDLQAGPFRVKLSKLPSVALDRIVLSFPPYTKLPERTINSGRFEAVEGTVASLAATANQPIRRARLEVDPQLDARGELQKAGLLLDLQSQEKSVTGRWPLRLNAAGDSPTHSTYRIRVFNVQDLGNADPILYNADIVADLPPEVNLPGPPGRTLKVTATGQLNLEIRGSDPDFGLSELKLTITQGNKTLADPKVFESEGALGRKAKVWRFKPSDYKGQTGDSFQIVGTASDNRHDPITGKPAPNIAASEPLTIEIVSAEELAAVPPEQKNSTATSKPDSQQDSDSNNRNDGSSAEGSERSNDSGTPNDASSGGESGKNQSGRGESGSDSMPDGSGRGKEEEPSASNSDNNSERENGKDDQPSKNQSKSGKGKDGESNSQQSAGGSGGSGGDNSKSQKKNDQSSGSGSGSGNSQEQENDSPEKSRSSSSQGGSSNSGKKSSANGNVGDSQSSEADSNNQPSGDAHSQGSAPRQSAKNGKSNGGGSREPMHDAEAIERIQQFMNEREKKNTQQRSNPNNSVPEKSRPAGSQQQSTQPSGSQQNGSQQSEAQQQGSQQTGSQQSSSQQSGSQQNGSQQSGSQQNGSQQNGSQQNGSQQNGSQQNGSQQNGSQQNGSQQNGSQQNGSRCNRTVHSRTARNRTARNRTARNRAAHNRTAHNRTSQQKVHNRAVHSRTVHNRTALNRTALNRTVTTERVTAERFTAERLSTERLQQSSSTERFTQNGSQQNGSQQNGSQQNGSQQNGSQQNGSQQNGSQQNGSQQSGSQQNGSQQSGSQQNGSQQAGSQQQGAQQSGSQQQGAQQSGAAKQNGSQQSGSQSGANATANSDSSSSSAGSQGSPQSGGRVGDAQPSNGSAAKGPASPVKPLEPGIDSDAYAQDVTNMVLEYLKRQKEQPDSDLLKELNWTKADVDAFLKRWESARSLADSADPESRRKWKEQLRSLGLSPGSMKGRATGGRDDSMQGLQDSGSRVRPPEALRKQYEAFRKAAGGSEN
ncbi:MAG: hypothetical protein U0892_04800 [Pirellulales bacterium]